MSNKLFYVCPGISSYSTYRNSIARDPSNVVHVVLPQDTVRHANCIKLYEKASTQKSLMCKSCLSLKHYLAQRKRKHNSLSSDTIEYCQKSTSSVSFDCLTPESKKIRLTNMKKEISSLKRTYSEMDRLELNDK